MKQLVINWKDQLPLYLKKPWSMRGPSVNESEKIVFRMHFTCVNVVSLTIVLNIDSYFCMSILGSVF